MPLLSIFIPTYEKGEQFRTREESDALAYYLDVHLVPLTTVIKVNMGDPAFNLLPL